MKLLEKVLRGTQSKDYFELVHAAQNPNTPTKALEQLATDKDYAVRYWVAQNPNTPHYIKKSLKIRYLLEKL